MYSNVHYSLIIDAAALHLIERHRGSPREAVIRYRTAMGQPSAVKLTLLDVDNVDVQDIMGALDDKSAGLRPEPITGDRYGEPGTIALALVVAQPVLLALAAWILKHRRKQQLEVRAKVLHADGSEVERLVKFTFTESESPNATVMKQLVDGFGLATGTIQGQAAAGAPAAGTTPPEQPAAQ
ncbi:hypothetical protein [Rugosimonospora africana]|uniref:Uncharacterized protein n=1 Tax=Rugosimonospora africana TaxID=556532 RepID=A0A8J3VS58_9ACTN|nr:hypothetical protein [Rugosimonospora africana]GIH16108.1 hypothetical protein Raf01_42800 [Rugosimonospora africana]